MRRRRRLGMLVAAVTVTAEALMLRRRGYGLAGNVVVRCREGHHFTTIWVPGASLKSLRLVWWRGQWCPVGRHWTLVTPVARAELAPDELRAAAEHRDIRIP